MKDFDTAFEKLIKGSAKLTKAESEALLVELNSIGKDFGQVSGTAIEHELINARQAFLYHTAEFNRYVRANPDPPQDIPEGLESRVNDVIKIVTANGTRYLEPERMIKEIMRVI